jgi:hypothetical protein
MKEYESYAKGGDDKSLSYKDYNRFLEDNYLFFKEKKENAKLVKEQEDRKLFNLSLNQLGKNFSNNFIQMLNDMVELINKYYINKKRGTHLTLKNIVNDLFSIIIKDDRLIYSGIFFILLSFFFYFMDISS